MSFDRMILWLVAVGILLGVLDKITGDRFGLGEKLDQGFQTLGALALSMVGILCLAPVIASTLSPILVPACRAIGADPALFGTLLANDMGGYALAMELAEVREAGLYVGTIVASMLGCTLVFAIPVGLSIIDREDQTYYSQGLLLGLITIPIGSLVGGFLAGFDAGLLLRNTLPVLVFSLLLAVGLRCIPKQMIQGCILFGRFITIVIYVGLGAAAFQHITGVVLIPGMAPILEAMEVIAGIGIVLLGTFPMLELLTRALKKPLNALGERLGLDGVSTAGLVFTMANSVPVFSMMKDMKKRGIVVNTAWLVPATCVLGDHLGFTAGVEPSMITPVIAAKFCAGVLALILSLWVTREMKE